MADRGPHPRGRERAHAVRKRDAGRDGVPRPIWAWVVVALTSFLLLITEGGSRLYVEWVLDGRPLGLRDGVLDVGVDASYPPFAVVGPDGDLVGLEVDLARELGERLDVPVHLGNTDAANGLDALVAGRYDLILAGLTYDPLLTQDVAFSAPYFEAGPVVLVAADRRVDRLDQLAGRAVGVELGSDGESAARRLARDVVPWRTVRYADLQALLRAVQDGEVDAAVLDRATALAEGPRYGLEPLGEPIASQPLVIAVRRPPRGLLFGVDYALRAMRADGTLTRIERRWLAGDGTSPDAHDPTGPEPEQQHALRLTASQDR